MNLCRCQPACRVSLGGPRRASSAPLLWNLPRLWPSMCLTRVVRGMCVVLSLHGRVLWLCLLLDVLYLACVYDAAPLSLPLPLSDNASRLENRSDSSSGSGSRSSSLLSLASHIAAPSAALLPSSLSLSSKPASHRPHSNASSNHTGASNSDAELAAANSSSETLSSHPGAGAGNRQAVTAPTAGKVRKEFPLALVVASATAAVSILLFFCLSYLWHTRQLDRRAQKLAIRLAAEVNSELQCAQCRPVATYRVGSSQDSGSSDSGGEDSGGVLRIPVTVLDELNSLNEEEGEEGDGEEEEEVGEDGSRRKAGGVGRTLGSKKGGRGRGGSRRSSSRSSRKWSGHSCGQTRSSLVTDQEILTHFASRRHSTFFI